MAISSPALEPAAQAAGPRLQRPAAAAASGLLLALAFPSPEVSIFAWVGLLPLLWACRDLALRRAFFLGWISGVAFYVATLYWIVHTVSAYTALPAIVAVFVLLLCASVLALYTGAFMAGLRVVERAGLSAVWLGPPLWAALEWLRSWFLIGFPWVALGYSQYRNRNLVQMAEVTGVYGISALLVFFNLVVFAVIAQRRSREQLRRQRPALVLLTGLMVLAPLLGAWRRAELRRLPAAGHLRVGIVQGNIDQDQKWDPAYQGTTLDRYEELTARVAASGAELVVWPETAAPFFFQEPGELRQRLLDLAARQHIYLLFGSPGFFQSSAGRLRLTNRAYLLSPEGREIGSYDKLKLVPFGEYVPFGPLLFFVHKMVVGVGDFVPGVEETVFRLPQARFSVLICYEAIFPDLTRRFVARGADFLVNITNDAWFGRTSAPHQHLAMATLRAIENRVPVVRAANSGISAIIDVDGSIRWRTGLFVAAARSDEISWPHVRTFYTRFGDLFGLGCALASAAALGYSFRHGRGNGKRAPRRGRRPR